MSQSQLEVFAYAKINLALAITGRREDGYHELESVMQSIGIYDLVRLTLQPKEIECLCGQFSGSDNLAYKAAQRFFRDLNTSQGVKIEIQKAIPAQAGLAGGSADAAATLEGLNTLLGNPYSDGELEVFAAELGADVAFCLRGGTQWASGVGERLKRLPRLPKFYLVIVKPAQGVDTGLAYRTFDEEGITSHLDYEQWKKALETGNKGAIPPLLYNDLEQASMKLVPEVLQIKEGLVAEEGCLGALMSGSGSAVFGLMTSEDEAKKTAEKYREKGYAVWVTNTVERGVCHG